MSIVPDDDSRQLVVVASTEKHEEIAAVIQCPVHLKLSVHVQRDWTRSEQGRRRLGYDS